MAVMDLAPVERPTLIGDVVWATAVTMAMSALSYLILQPRIGIDDANITQVYAQHLARGQGFRYDAGGELVEGSTSLLWTLLLVPFYWATEHPEGAIAGFCGVVTLGTVILVMRLARMVATPLSLSPGHAAWASAGALTFFPAFFAWSVWTLMDLTIWVSLLVGLVYSIVTLFLGPGNGATESRATVVGLMCFAVLVPLARPEGAVITVGLLGVLGLGAVSLRNRSLLITATGAFVMAVSAVGCVTIWRLSYFGQLLPNTVYAKVSTGWLAQLEGGLVYLATYLAQPIHAAGAALITSAGVFALVGLPFGRALRSRWSWCAITATCYVWGVFALYTAAGGDHFGSFRFFQPLTPLLAVAVGLAFNWTGRTLLAETPARRAMSASLVLCLLFMQLSHLAPFVARRGDLAHEFHIAEEGREVGAILNDLSWSPSIGVVTAGGVAMTFRGRIYDLMGLNWKKMAHAVSDLSGTVRNHGGFEASVLFDTLPDIVLPKMGPCSVADYPDSFSRRAMKDVFQDEQFIRRYTPACYRGLVFFVRRDRLKISTDLTQVD
jgi:hypothetical protein